MSDRITSLQNPRVKQAVKLRDRAGRRKQGRFVIDGLRELTRACDAGIELDEVFYCPEFFAREEQEQLLARLEAAGVPRVEVTSAVFEKLAYGARGEGFVAVAIIPSRTLEDISLPANPLVAVIERAEKPGNLGAVLRSADGAGVSAVVAADPQTDLWNPNCIRASLGTVFSVPSAVCSVAAACAWLMEQGLQVYATDPEAEWIYTKADFRGPSAILLGSEAEGLSAEWEIPPLQRIALPMRGIADSLNVSASAAVLFYEALRQRTG